jgi:hypothetical protein
MELTKKDGFHIILTAFLTAPLEETVRLFCEWIRQPHPTLISFLDSNKSFYFTLPICLLLIVWWIYNKFRKHSDFKIRRVKNYASKEIFDALELYKKRIPPNERFDEGDIIRWLKEDQKRIRDFFFIARENKQVVGFTLIHFHEKVRLAFIAYLVSKKGRDFDGHKITYSLFKVVIMHTKKFKLRKCKAFLFEVDDPKQTGSEIKSKCAIARIRHFMAIAAQLGYDVRAINIEYKQPHLFIPSEEFSGKEHPMLLMYAIRKMPPFLTKSEVETILDNVYNWLYPESFSEIQQEIDDYKCYLKKLYTNQINSLPQQINLLNLNQIQKKHPEIG